MADLGKVIKGLEVCIPIDEGEDCSRECPYYQGICLGYNQLMRDALALLKEQEPRVMALDEIKDGESYWLSAGKQGVTRPVICVYREDDSLIPYIVFVWQFGTISFVTEEYGKTWRCWTAKPTEEQRKGEMWE